MSDNSALGVSSGCSKEIYKRLFGKPAGRVRPKASFECGQRANPKGCPRPCGVGRQVVQHGDTGAAPINGGWGSGGGPALRACGTSICLAAPYRITLQIRAVLGKKTQFDSVKGIESSYEEARKIQKVPTEPPTKVKVTPLSGSQTRVRGPGCAA